MGTIIEAFHVDLKLLIAQAINFSIVFFVLYYFVFKPLVKIMGDRTQRIEKSLEDAKKIEERLNKTEDEYKEKISQARKEAEKIIEEARQQAEKKRNESVVKAKEDIGKIINDEKANIQVEKAKILKEIKLEVSELIASSVEKVLEKKLDGNEDKELIKKVLKSSN